MVRTRRSLLGLLATIALRAQDGFELLLERVVEPVGAELGFAMHHFESGERRSVRGGERFPMASVYKLPIALTVLHEVDEGRISLGQTIRLTPNDLRLGMGTDALARLVLPNGHDFQVRELVERTLVDSDNASSDALLGLVGARAVTERMAALGVPEIRVDRPEVALLLDYVGASSTPPPAGWTYTEIETRYRSAREAQRRQAQLDFLRDPRDTTTPDAMANLLARIHRGQTLQPASHELLIGWMRGCKTGGARLRGDLPADTVFAHRTGTTDTTNGVTACTNDVGILTLPDGAGHVAIAAFLRTARGTMDERERALSRIGRSVFERYAGAGSARGPGI